MSPSQSKTQPGSRKPTYEAATKSRPSPGHSGPNGTEGSVCHPDVAYTDPGDGKEKIVELRCINMGRGTIAERRQAYVPL